MTVLSPDQIAQVARAAGFPENAVPMAVAVALCESGGNTDAHGDIDRPHRGCGSYGLWQINSCPDRDKGSTFRFGDDPSRLYDPATNARTAVAVSVGGANWSAWSTKSKAAAMVPTLKLAGRPAPASAGAAAGAAAGNPGAAAGAAAGADAGAVATPSNSAGASGPVSLTSASTWLRVAQFVGGIVIIGVGASLVGVDIFGAAGGLVTKATAATNPSTVKP